MKISYICIQQFNFDVIKKIIHDFFIQGIPETLAYQSIIPNNIYAIILVDI